MNRRAFLQNGSLAGLYFTGFSLYSCSEKTEVASMPSSEIEILDIVRLGQMYRSGKISIKYMTEMFLSRIEWIDRSTNKLNSIIQTNPDAITIAEELDNELKSGKDRGPLHGIQIILKDNINTADNMYTTAGSRALANNRAPKDAHITGLLREAGAVILAKANLSEWANFRGERSSSGWSGINGLTRNPYITDRNPCGSSAGSGVAVSANLCMLAIGTETNGSIVCPSSSNGIVGIKPTVGLISRNGIIPISFTQDTAGPMARRVSDAAMALGVLTTPDNTDSKTLEPGRKAMTDYTVFLKKDGLKGKKLAHYTVSRGRHKAVDALMETAIQDMKSLGAEIIEIDSSALPGVGSDSFTVMLYEYKDGLNKYFKSLGDSAPVKSVEELIAFNSQDSVELKYFGQEYLEMAEKKGNLDSEEYQLALKRMLKTRREEGIDKVLKEFELDAFIAPTGGPAWKSDLINGDHFILGSSSPAAQAGYPNITVPMGFVDELPVGISFFGTAWSEGPLIEMAYAYEQSTMHRKAPQFLTRDS